MEYPKKPAAKSKKHKPTGEAQVFKRIWAERPHICEHCSGSLGDDAKTFFFAHIQRKSQAPGLRLIKMNIRLLCIECHMALDAREYEKLEYLEDARAGQFVGHHIPASKNKYKPTQPDIYELGFFDL